MTLILSHLSKLVVIQASDRLTTQNGNEFDREANKTLVLIAPDGVASVSFCGLALFKNEPADIYLAKSLIGEIPDFFGRVPNMGPCLCNKMRKIDDMLFAIQATAENAMKNSFTARRSAFGLSICGWRIRNGREEPFALNMMKGVGKSKLSILEKTPRRWTNFQQVYVSHLPANYIKAEGEKKIIEASKKKYKTFDESCDAWRDCFVDLIRLSAKKTRLVGMDAMIVVLPPPSIKKIAIRHVPIAMQHVSWKFAQNVPIAYSPWIIGQKNFYAPSVLSGNKFQHFVDDTEIIFHAPQNKSGVTYIGTYHRRII